METKESVLDKSSYVVGHVMVLYSPDRTNIGFSSILISVNLFRHFTHIKHGLYFAYIFSFFLVTVPL